MAAGVTWSGMTEFKREIKAIAPDLAKETDTIFLEAAEAALARIYQTYPRGETGNLRKGLYVRTPKGTLAGAILIQAAPHGHLYEYGTKKRKTARGYNRGWMFKKDGLSPSQGKPTFIPIATEFRDKAMSEVSLWLFAHGAARLTGDP